MIRPTFAIRTSMRALVATLLISLLALPRQAKAENESTIGALFWIAGGVCTGVLMHKAQKAMINYAKPMFPMPVAKWLGIALCTAPPVTVLGVSVANAKESFPMSWVAENLRPMVRFRQCRRSEGRLG